MRLCPITGETEIQCIRYEPGDLSMRELRWLRADDEVHVVQELLDGPDDVVVAFITATYEVGEQCPYQPGTRHARKRREGLA